jgi:hypothetical protein
MNVAELKKAAKGETAVKSHDAEAITGSVESDLATAVHSGGSTRASTGGAIAIISMAASRLRRIPVLPSLRLLCRRG